MIKRNHFFRKKDTKDHPDLKTLFAEFSNEQLISALKQRTYYVPEAEIMIIEEAIKRGIIFSEQDLLAEEFRVEKLHFSFFPNIGRAAVRDRIRKSIARSLVLAGAIPVVFGMVEINKAASLEGGLILLFGLFWIFSASRLVMEYQVKYIWLLVAALALFLIYITAKIIVMKQFYFMDILIPVVVFGLVLYGLLFLFKMYED